MTAINQNFSMFAGDSKTIVMRVYGESVDLTNASISWTVRKSFHSNQVLIGKTVTNGGIRVGEQNKIYVYLDPRDTLNLKGDYVHVCKIVDSNGDTSTLSTGTVEIKQGLSAALLTDFPEARPPIIPPSTQSFYTSVQAFGAKGDGISDDTEAFNNAINSLPDGGVVFVPYGKTYMIQGWKTGGTHEFPTGGVRLKDNITLMMEGATLKIIPNNQDGYVCINITNCTNTKVVGGTLVGDRYQHGSSGSGRSAQWGMGVSVMGSKDVFLEHILAKDFHGDGFCIGADRRGFISENVNMRHCEAFNNRRNGLSIIGCDGGVIKNNTFRKSNGHSPESGIDVEPNPGKTVTGMVIENNRCLENFQHGILMASIQEDTPSASNCTISKNICKRNVLSGILTNGAHRNIIEANICSENGNNGFSILNSNYNNIVNNFADNNSFYGFMMGNNSSFNNVISTFAHNNSRAQNRGYANICIFNAHFNNIQTNKAFSESNLSTQYGLYINSDAIGNLLTNNDMVNGGHWAGINNASPDPLNGAGNRGNDEMVWGTQNTF